MNFNFQVGKQSRGTTKASFSRANLFSEFNIYLTSAICPISEISKIKITADIPGDLVLQDNMVPMNRPVVEVRGRQSHIL